MSTYPMIALYNHFIEKEVPVIKPGFKLNYVYLSKTQI